MSKKKIVLGVIVLILLAFIFILPVRCTPVISGFDETSDALRPFKSQTCYSIYHPKFWIDEKEQSTQVIWGSTAKRALMTNHEVTASSFMDPVYQTIIHHE